METRNIVQIFIGLIVCLQTFICVMAMQKTNLDEFTMEDQSTQRRKNYMMKKSMDYETSSSDDTSIKYTNDYLDSESMPDELPSFIVDYANMIRNDIVMLDKSVETRTRKRGNIKVKKYNQAKLDIPCSCEQVPNNKEHIYLGEDYFPSSVETRNCNKHLCPSLYNCQENQYNITVLKKTGHKNQISQMEVPIQFKKHWMAIRLPVTIGCICTRDHVDNY